MKKWYQSRTLWLAVFQGALGVLLALQGLYPDVGYIIILKSIVDMLIRLNTVTTIE